MKLWLLKWLLRTPNNEMRARILSTALEEIGAFPARAIINVSIDGTISVNGKPVDFEYAMAIRASAKAIKESIAWNFVREQTAFAAVNIGVHNGDTPEKVIFSRAALWWSQQQQELFDSLAE